MEEPRSPRRVASVSTLEPHPVPCTSRSCTPASRVSPSGGPASSASIDVRVRCRRSVRVPDSTARPARMMLTRSQSFSTSARMWLDSSTVRPGSRYVADAVLEHRPPSAGRARRWARRGGAARVRRERSDEGDLLPVPLGVRPRAAWSGRARTGRAGQRAWPGRYRRAGGRAGRSPRRPSGWATGYVAGHVREPAVQRRGVLPRVAAEQRGLTLVGPQHAEQHADRRRLARAVGPRKPCTSPAATSRSRPSSARPRRRSSPAR